MDGVGDYTYWLSQELSSRGHEVHIICNRNGATDDLAGQVKVYPTIEEWTTPNFKIALVQIMDLQPDWVIFQYVPYAFHAWGMPVFLVKFLQKIKKKGFQVFVFFHEFYIGLHFRSLKATLVALTQLWITKRMCKYADQVATSTDHYVRVLQQWCGDIHQIPIGSNVPAPNPIPPAKDAHTFRVITFGLRNVEVLLHFFSLIKEEIQDLRLIVCGKQHLPASQDPIDNVHFTGYLPGDEVAKWLASADVFLLPDFVSKKGEGGTCLKSGSLAAAFAAGLPIIGMKGKMNDRLLMDLDGVQLVDYYNYETWKAAILKVYHQRKDGLGQGAAIRRFYEQHLAWRSIGDRYLKIMNNAGL